MYSFYFEEKKKENKSNIPPSAEISEDINKISEKELDEYFRKGKDLEPEKTRKDNK